MVAINGVKTELVANLKDAFFIFAGALMGNYLMRFLDGVIPAQIRDFNEEVNVVLASLLAINTSGIIRQLATGWAISSGVAVLGKYLNPVIASVA